MSEISLFICIFSTLGTFRSSSDGVRERGQMVWETTSIVCLRSAISTVRFKRQIQETVRPQLVGLGSVTSERQQQVAWCRNGETNQAQPRLVFFQDWDNRTLVFRTGLFWETCSPRLSPSPRQTSEIRRGPTPGSTVTLQENTLEQTKWQSRNESVWHQCSAEHKQKMGFNWPRRCWKFVLSKSYILTYSGGLMSLTCYGFTNKRICTYNNYHTYKKFKHIYSTNMVQICYRSFCLASDLRFNVFVRHSKRQFSSREMEAYICFVFMSAGASVVTPMLTPCNTLASVSL